MPSAAGRTPSDVQIPAALQSRITAADRKRRTRRLILMGSYLEHVTQADSDRKARLMKELDRFLERDRDRELFGLVRQKEATPPLSPRPG